MHRVRIEPQTFRSEVNILPTKQHKLHQTLSILISALLGIELHLTAINNPNLSVFVFIFK